MTKAANKKELAVVGESLPDVTDGELEGLSGFGYSERADDSLIPILGILQDQSGETKKKHDRYKEGAEPGMLIVRSLQKMYDVEEHGVLFQPCAFQHMWVEWTGEPGEGAPVAQYPFDDRPSEAEEVPDPNNPDSMIWRMPSGNRLIDTRYHYGHLFDADGSIMPMVIPFAGSNHTVSKGWTSLMKHIRHPSTGQKIPSWFRVYEIKTDFTQRGAQSWYKFAVSDKGWCTDKEVRDAGRALFESVSANVVQADIKSDAESADAGDEAPI